MAIGLTLEGLVSYIIEEIHNIKLRPSAIREDETHRFVSDEEKDYWNKKAENVLVSSQKNGLMSIADKNKLDDIAFEANKYIHPDIHPATMIIEDNAHMFITKSERDKLATVAMGATNYTHPDTHPATMITEDATHRFMTDEERDKLATVAMGANNYTHPLKHEPSIIAQDANNRFVTDIQIANWNDKYSKSEIENKFNSYSTGLDWKESVATYSDIITTYPNPKDGWTVNVKDLDLTYRYTGQKWIPISANSIPLATEVLDGKMSAVDKAKLNGIAIGATNYIHPSAHHATMIVEDSTHRFVTDAQITSWTTCANTVHTSLVVPDTRNVEINVGDYRRNFALDFKLNSKLNYPDASTYSTVCTISPYSDASGGATHQLVFTGNGGLYHRYGIEGSGWAIWGKLARISDIPISLPANGGNADTVDGKHAFDFAASIHTHTGSQITTAVDNATNANYATKAGTADYATDSGYATKAGSATTATTAQNIPIGDVGGNIWID